MQLGRMARMQRRIDAVRCIVLLSVIFALVSSQACDTDNGWLEHEGACYYISSTGEETDVTWHDARAWCMNQGGDLASIHNENETQLIYEMADGEDYGGDLWIGLNKLRGQDSYTWSDGTESEYTDWKPGHPLDNGLHQCTYQRGKPIDECWTYRYGINTIRGVLYYPSDADGYNTFYFGYTYGGVAECQGLCAQQTRCHSFTFFESYYYDYIDWIWQAYQCAGRSDFINAQYPETYVTSGHREDCKEEAETSWYSGNCGHKKGFVCKKQPGSDSPVTIPPTDVVPGYCPQGYFGVDNKCFMMVEGVHNEAWTWEEAREICRSIPGGDLASFQTQEQNAAITTRLQFFYLGFWIGHYKDSSQWIWSDNSGPGFTNWAANRPGYSGDCAEIWTEGSEFGRWNDRSCGEGRGYICQVFKDGDSIIATPPSTTQHNCAQGWTPYWYGCYQFEDTPLSWQEAQNRCHSKGSELVSFVGAAENAAVSLMAGNNAYWIGLKKANDGVFRWEDGWPTHYTNWGLGQPGGGEGCVRVNVNANGQWIDSECNQLYPSVCKTTDVPAPTTPEHTEGACVGSGWIPYGSHCYYVGSSTANWEEARVNCMEHGGAYHTDATLASIHSPAENDFIRQSFLAVSSYYDPWIGLFKQNKDAPFEWTDGTPVDFSVWAPGEPNGDDDFQLCVEMYVTSWPGLWNDHTCTDWGRTYVCKAAKVTGVVPTTPPGVTLPTPPVDVPGTCPSDDWERYGHNCYLFKPDLSTTWDGARDACVNLGGASAALVSIHDEAENNFVLMNIQGSLSTSTWIGLNYNYDPGEYENEENINAIKGIINSPSEADGVNTFQLGYTGSTADDPLLCQAKCDEEPNCKVYTYYYNDYPGPPATPDPVWYGECVGRTDLYSVWETEARTASGTKIGGGDGGHEWVDGSEVIYTNWAPGEPNGGNDEPCVDMYTTTAGQASPGTWNDIACTQTRGYVCKALKEGIPPGYSTTTVGGGAVESTKLPDDGSGNGMSTGAIVGIVVGALLGVAVIAGAIFGAWYFMGTSSQSKSSGGGTAGFENNTYGIGGATEDPFSSENGKVIMEFDA